MTEEQVLRVVDEMMDRMWMMHEKETREEQLNIKKECLRLMWERGNRYSDVPQGAVVFNKENENARD